MTFRPYISGRVFIEPDEIKEFATLAELEALPEVRRAMEAPGFHRLSLDVEVRNCGNARPALMAEFDHGAHWKVVGYIAHPTFHLPIFRFRAVAFAA